MSSARSFRHHGFHFAVDAHLGRSRAGGHYPEARDSALFPFEVHDEPAARPQPGGFAGGPGLGQGGQEFDFPGVRLQEHLANGGGLPEVAVDLELRARVVEVRGQIRINAPLQVRVQDRQCGVPVAEPGVGIGLERALPASHQAALPPLCPVENPAQGRGQPPGCLGG